MDVLIYLIPASLLLAGGALAAFLWSLKSGQYDDIEGAAHRILMDDDKPIPPSDDEDDQAGADADGVGAKSR